MNSWCPDPRKRTATAGLKKAVDNTIRILSSDKYTSTESPLPTSMTVTIGGKALFS